MTQVINEKSRVIHEVKEVLNTNIQTGFYAGKDRIETYCGQKEHVYSNGNGTYAGWKYLSDTERNSRMCIKCEDAKKG